MAKSQGQMEFEGGESVMRAIGQPHNYFYRDAENDRLEDATVEFAVQTRSKYKG